LVGTFPGNKATRLRLDAAVHQGEDNIERERTDFGLLYSASIFGLMQSNPIPGPRQRRRLREQEAVPTVSRTKVNSPSKPNFYIAYKQWTKLVFPLLVCFRMINALCVKTFFQPDEYFQSLEPAWMMAFGSQSGAWITWVGSESNGSLKGHHILKVLRNGNTNSAHLCIQRSLLLSIWLLKRSWRA
jgi:hypothetical protein